MLHDWGVVLAKAMAPFSVLGLSPALVMVFAGVVGVQLFIAWTQRRQARHLTPLLALRVIESPREHAAALAMMAIFMLANALTFLVPLYIQMVQGRTSFETAVAMIPYQVAVFAAAISVLCLYDRLSPRRIARYSFVLVSAALVLLSVEMNHEFSDLLVILSLVMFGLGQGALATLLFDVLVTYAPKQFAGDVGSLRGTIKSLASGIGTAVAGALAVGILSANVQRSLVDNPAIPPELIKQVDLDRANFVSNGRLKDVMTSTTATPAQIAEAVRINVDARQRALKLSFLLLGGVALLVIVPVGRLPGYVRGRGPEEWTPDAGTVMTARRFPLARGSALAYNRTCGSMHFSCRLPIVLSLRSRLLRAAAAFGVAGMLAVAPARAAEPPPFTAAELDQMLAPIALFPDALLSQVLMASTYPSDVAQAVEWAYAHRKLEGDAAVKAVQDKPWDPSVQSLVAFPQVLAMFGESPQWVRDLGDAFLDQPGEVMDSVQFLRAKAKEAGNLASNEHQVIAVEPAPPPPQVIVVNAPPPPTQIITIVPANPQVVFVPIFNPVWAFGPWWHPGFPPFFFPPPPRWGWGWGSVVHTGIWWGVGIGVSNALWGGVDWRRRDVNINVNRWNNINVNRRIDSRDRDVSWRHDVRNRHGVPYRGAATRDRLQQAVGDARGRDEYRGRDVQRDRARQELADRVGTQNLDRDALRNIDRSQLPQRPGASDAGSQPCAIAPPTSTASQVAESRRQRRPVASAESRRQRRPLAIAESRRQCRPFASCRIAPRNVDRSQLQNRAANVDRSQLQNRNANAAAINRDNALRGAGNAAQTRQQIDRGTASRGAMQQRASGAAGGAAGRRR